MSFEKLIIGIIIINVVMGLYKKMKEKADAEKEANQPLPPPSSVSAPENNTLNPSSPTRGGTNYPSASSQNEEMDAIIRERKQSDMESTRPGSRQAEEKAEKERLAKEVAQSRAEKLEKAKKVATSGKDVLAEVAKELGIFLPPGTTIPGTRTPFPLPIPDFPDSNEQEKELDPYKKTESQTQYQPIATEASKPFEGEYTQKSSRSYKAELIQKHESKQYKKSITDKRSLITDEEGGRNIMNSDSPTGVVKISRNHSLRNNLRDPGKRKEAILHQLILGTPKGLE